MTEFLYLRTLIKFNIYLGFLYIDNEFLFYHDDFDFNLLKEFSEYTYKIKILVSLN